MTQHSLPRPATQPALLPRARELSWTWTDLWDSLAVGILIGLSVWSSMLMNGPLNFAVFWPANGILLGCLLCSPQKRWTGFLIAGFLASVLVHLPYQYGLKSGLILSLANIIEVLIAAWPFQHLRSAPPDLTRPRTLLIFTSMCFIAPFFSGILSVGTGGVWTPNPVVSQLTLFRGWYIGDVLGLILMTPLMLAILRKESLDLFRWRQLPETLLVLAALVTPNLLLTEPKRFPLLFLNFPLLVLVAFRLGLPGAAIGVVLTSIPISRYAINGIGIFSLPEYAGQEFRTLLVQAFIFVQLVMVYLISSVLAERKRLEAELRGSEERYRGMADHSWDIIIQTDLRGVRSYVSPSVLETTGWTAQELLGRSFRDDAHPDDQRFLERMLDRLNTGFDKQILVYRMLCKDSSYLWVEAKTRVVLDTATGSPREFVAVIRDVSARVARDQALRAAYDRAESRALTDGLTGLGNRRGFDERMKALWKYDLPTPLSLLMIDADHFKQFNDAYGHQAGDDCLRAIARIVSRGIRQKDDYAARYGGEEFAVLLPETDTQVAFEIAERIREAVAAAELHLSPDAETGYPALSTAQPHPPATDLRRSITVSIGIATCSSKSTSTERDLIHAADMALYEAKRSGRNRICTQA